MKKRMPRMMMIQSQHFLGSPSSLPDPDDAVVVTGPMDETTRRGDEDADDADDAVDAAIASVDDCTNWTHTRLNCRSRLHIPPVLFVPRQTMSSPDNPATGPLFTKSGS